jgi:excisionase family DNA binding protein
MATSSATPLADPAPAVDVVGRALAQVSASPWLRVEDVCARAQVGRRTVYDAVKNKRLRAARINGRRDLRFLAAWVDEWLVASSEPIEVR